MEHPLAVTCNDLMRNIKFKEHSDYATSLHNIGIVYLELGEYSKSLDCLQEALEKLRVF